MSLASERSDKRPPLHAGYAQPVPRRISVRWIASLLLLLVSLALSAVIGSIAWFELQYDGRIYPGVYVDSVDLSGFTPAEAKGTLSRLFKGTADWQIRLTYGDKVWLPARETLGIFVDVEETVRQAYAVGRSGTLLERLWAQWQAQRAGEVISPVVRFDKAQARRYLSSLAAEVRVPVKEATLRVADGRVELTPSQIGYELDEAATLRRLESAVQARRAGDIGLIVREIPPVISDFSGLAERVERLISQPIELIGPTDAPRNHWGLLPQDLASMLVLQQRVESGGKIVGVAALSEAALAARVAEIAKELDRPPREGKVDWDMRAGRLIVVEPSQTGYKLDTEKTVQLIQEHALSQMRQVKLPVTELKPQIDTNNLPALGIREQVVKATTYFKGSSAERTKNIKLATARFEGILIPPGEIFSFNKYLGEVTPEKGYTESLVIWGDRTAVGIGGGICQVSTTAFRAAFWAGLEILERWAHGYRVEWYEPPVGMDATVFSPVVDFKFRNDTPYYLLMKTELDLQAGALSFYLFGTKTGRTVEMTGPVLENTIPAGPPEYREDPSLPAGVTKQVEWAHDGVDVTVKRTVKQGDKVIHQDTFFSRYQPWRAVFLVGKKS